MSDAPSPPDPPQRPGLSKRLGIPHVSGTWTVILLLFCFVLTTGLVLLVFRKLPEWVEFEIVVGTWWLLWALVLTKLLYMGEQIADDYKHRQPRSWFDTKNLDGCSSGGSDAEGCVVVLGLIVALFLVWILIEFAVPIIFFMLYFLVRGMLVRVVNDKPQCQGNIGLSAFRGIFWATIYTAPLALTIYVVHFLHQRAGG